jgi:phosphoenolpyruvate carboxylase
MTSVLKLSQKETAFNQEVVTRFELYNSLFLTLPFYQVKDTGILLPFFSSHCEHGAAEQMAPLDIIRSFFEKYVPDIDREERLNRLFRFIQYIERQVVLFDSIEDAAFNKLGHTDEGGGTLQGLLQQAQSRDEMRKTIGEKLSKFSLRLVLTAHPTQFYPGPVLGIMTDLSEALKHDDINSVNLLLQQLGKTPFFNKTSPTPVDEAVSLAWFLENIFYNSAALIQAKVDEQFDGKGDHEVIELGFWPGGDRDGNPNVSSKSTEEVVEHLRRSIFRCYYREFKEMKKRITFRGVNQAMGALENILYQNAYNANPKPTNQKDEILTHLGKVKEVLEKDHYSLFVGLVDSMIRKVKLFGCYFATLDIRQDSRVLRNVYQYCTDNSSLKSAASSKYFDLDEDDKLKAIQFTEINYSPLDDADALVKDTLQTIRLMKDIQQSGGEKACQRFIISNCQQASDILQLMNLFLWSGWKKEQLSVDFMPLFETVHDLANAAEVMEKLYTHPYYKEHLKRRNNKQTIMLGFSDSTKDGGYLMANWSIYKGKVELTAMALKYGIELAFFDGRGGPPARGGGKTHRFYSSMGKEIANDHIQLTIQGQTVSSLYGSQDTAVFNMEQLVNAGIVSAMHPNSNDLVDDKHKKLMSDMAETSHKKFLDLREHPLFLKYLEKMSPLKLLSNINISSRPTKRNAGTELKLEDLRAISFVTSWSQLKQNIPGFYGVGTALKQMKDEGHWKSLKELYKSSGFFKTMIDNCMMSMSKSDFRITAYLAEDKTFGAFWKMLKDEFDLTTELLLTLTDSEVLMQEYPVERKSIAIREKIVLPLVILQHFALQQLNTLPADDKFYAVYNKLIVRTVYGIVNAGRNLA